MAKRKGICSAVFLSALIGAGSAFAAVNWRHPDRVEWRLGYGGQYTNEKARPNTFQFTTVLPSAVYPLTDPIGPAWFRGRFEWQPELFLAVFDRQNVRPLFGVTPLQFRYLLEPLGRWSPYGFCGVGFLYSNINSRETRSDWNFNPQFGFGTLVTLSDAVSLLLEYRHIHISNAGLHENNSGLNAHTFLAGVSFKQ